MFNNLRLTDSANTALQNAGGVALQFGSYSIDSEHILYGLTVISDSVSSKILKNYGVTSESLITVFAKLYKNTSTIISRDVDIALDGKECLIVASQFASQIGHDFVGTEHLLISLLLGDNYKSSQILRKYFKINTYELRNNVLQVIKSNSMSRGSMDTTFSYGEELYDRPSYQQSYSQNYNQEGLPDFIKDMGRDLTQKARDGKIDPIIGRQEETERMIEILCRKNKNNPVLIGEAGVGKSAVVDGLALAIANGEVPELLKNKTIFSLELGSLMAGTKYRGDLEEKLKQVIDYIVNNKDIIVFIDEIHTLMQVSDGKGGINPADML